MVNQKRAKNTAVAGALLLTALTVAMTVLWSWTDSYAALTCVWMLAAGIPLWIVAALLSYCRQLQKQEEMELEAMAAGRGETIFEEEAEHLRPAAARSAWMDKWIIPSFTLLMAGIHATVGILLINYLAGKDPAQPVHTNAGMLFVVLMGFAAFLFSQYTIGMSSRGEWRLLRACGSYMLGGVIVMLAVLIGLLSAWQKHPVGDLYLAYVGPAVQLILAAEMVMNFVLDLYRPRVPGEIHRPPFESRLLNIIAEPGRIGRSVADALNYQFGFEVSRTWFYQLLSRAFVPMIIFAAVVLFGISSIVIVNEGQQCILLHFGKTSPNRTTLGPGIHLKWPWPIDRGKEIDTARIRRAIIGSGGTRSEKERQNDFVKGKEIYLWKAEHGKYRELDFLVAVQKERDIKITSEQENPPPVNLIKLMVSVNYTIKDPYAYAYNYADTGKVLQSVAYRQMTDYCATATLNEKIPGQPDRPQAILTSGREKLGRNLRRIIQQAANELNMGVNIEYVDVLSAHPPPETAESYEKVTEMERRVDQKLYEARAEANRMLAEVAGDPSIALRLSFGIRMARELQTLKDASDLQKRVKELKGSLQSDVARLSGLIKQEKLLGRKPTEIIDLKQMHMQYMRELEEIATAEQKDLSPLVQKGLADTREKVETLFSQASGQAAVLMAKAKAYRWKKEFSERADYRNFLGTVMAYQACPEVFTTDRWLDVWEEVLPDITKYVLGVDREKLEIWLNIEREPQLMEGAYQGGSE